MAEVGTAQNVAVQPLAHLHITHIMLGLLLLRDTGIAGMKGEDTLLKATGCCCAHIISLNSLVELE